MLSKAFFGPIGAKNSAQAFGLGPGSDPSLAKLSLKISALVVVVYVSSVSDSVRVFSHSVSLSQVIGIKKRKKVKKT